MHTCLKNESLVTCLNGIVLVCHLLVFQCILCMLCQVSLHRYWPWFFEENPYIYAYILSDYNFNLVKLVFVSVQCVCGTSLLFSFLRGEKSWKIIKWFTQSHVLCFLRAICLQQLTAQIGALFCESWSSSVVRCSHSECPAGLKAFLCTKCTKSRHTSLVETVAQQHLWLRQ